MFLTEHFDTHGNSVRSNHINCYLRNVKHNPYRINLLWSQTELNFSMYACQMLILYGIYVTECIHLNSV